jgi:6-phosphogluconolactonase
MKTISAHRAEVKICDSPTEMGTVCANEFVRIINAAIEAHGRCSVALSGGSTPSLLYKQLVSKKFASKVNWDQVHFFVSDERCVPLEDKDSNFGTGQRELLTPLGIAESNLHPPPNPEGNPQESASEYERQIKEFFGLKDGEWPRFDLPLLGMGPDGHCASLFPNTPALKEDRRIVVANRVNFALHPMRLTFTFPAINHGRNIIFLVQGNEKAHILGDVLGSTEVSDYPVEHVRPVDGHLQWIIDANAASELLKQEAGSR